MAKNDPKRGLDEQPLEGGGGGAGSASALETVAKVGGPAALTFLGGVGGSQIIKNAREKREAEEAASKADVKSQAVQEAKDAKMQVKKDKAYNAAKTYPDNFAKGGMTASARADGIAQRGKTRGTIIR